MHKKLLRYSLLFAFLSSAVLVENRAMGQTTPTTEKPDSPKKGDSKKKNKKKKVPKGKKTTAAELVDRLNEATAYVAANAAKAKGLDPKKKQQIPFWQGLKTLTVEGRAMKSDLAQKKKSYFEALKKAGKGVAQLQSGYRMARVKDKKLSNGVKAVAATYNQLRTNYGPFAGRKKSGGKPGDAELKKIAQLQAELKALRARMKNMGDMAMAYRNRRIARETADLFILLDRLIGYSVGDLDSYLDFLFLNDTFSYDWYAIGEVYEYWYPEAYESWRTCDDAYNAYYNDYTQVYESYATAEPDWDLYETTSYEVVDTTEVYSVTETETTETTYVDNWEESTATTEMTEEEYTTDSADEEVYEEGVFDVADDDDGDGLEDSLDTDDDNDGVPDAEDQDDDGDGVNDDDSDGDGTPDEADTDDDGDGVEDTVDTDDDGDGINDEIEEEVDVDDDAGEDDGDMGDDGSDDGGDDDASGDDGGDDDGGGEDAGGDEGE